VVNPIVNLPCWRLHVDASHFWWDIRPRKRIEGGRAVFDVTLPKPLGLTPKNFPNRPGVGIAKIKEGAGVPLRKFRVGNGGFSENIPELNGALNGTIIWLVDLPASHVWLPEGRSWIRHEILATLTLNLGAIRGQVAIRNLGVQTSVTPLLQCGVMCATNYYQLL
jgi:hypothetical protein